MIKYISLWLGTISSVNRQFHTDTIQTTIGPQKVRALSLSPFQKYPRVLQIKNKSNFQIRADSDSRSGFFNSDIDVLTNWPEPEKNQQKWTELCKIKKFNSEILSFVYNSGNHIFVNQLLVYISLPISLFPPILSFVVKFILLISTFEEIEMYKEVSTITDLGNVYINQKNTK